jgi:hypothetical protein
MVSLLGGAYLMSKAHAPGGVPAVAWLALFPLFVCISVLAPGRAALAGAFWGACLCVFNAFGASPANGDFPVSALPFVPSWLRAFVPLLVLLLSPALYAGLAAWLTRWIGFSPFVLGVGWMGVELVLAPLDLSVGLLAVQQTDAGTLHWLSHALGCVFIGFLIAYVNAALVEMAGRVCLPRSCPRIMRPFDEVIIRLHSEVLAFFNRIALEPCQPRAPPSHHV